jgi:hypothetical protein
MKLSAVFSPFFIECMMLRDNNYPWLFFLFLEKKETNQPALLGPRFGWQEKRKLL